MIPLRLTVSNFMSYPEGTPPVDLSCFHVACLSGENGNGKSALLEAITWSLWGEARAHADNLVRMGQQEMRVDLEFMVDGVRYVVSRRRSRKGGGATHTELSVVTDDGQYRSQTGTGERLTQEKINRILGMEYRAFINSAFILQGRTDEFTRQKPTERKEILAEILDLGRYDRLEEMARARQRTAEDRSRVLQGEIETLAQDLARLPEHEASLVEAQGKLDAAAGQRDSYQERLTHLQLELTALSAQAALLTTLAEQARRAAEQAEQVEQRRKNLRARISTLDSKLQRRDEIEAQMALLVEARQELEKMELARERHLQIEREERRLEVALAERRHAIEIRQSRVEVQLKELGKRGGEAPRLRREIEKLSASHQPLAVLEKVFDALREDRDAQVQKMQSAIAEMGARDRDLERLAQRRALLEQPAADCPLCAQPLDEHDHARLLSSLDDEQARLHEDYDRLENERAAAAAAESAIKQKARLIKQQIDEARKCDQDAALLQQELQEAEDAAERIPEAQSALAAIHLELKGEIEPEITGRLRILREDRIAAGYDAARHDALRIGVRKLEPAERELSDIAHADETRADALRQLEEGNRIHDTHEKEMIDLRTQMASMADVPERKGSLESVMRQLGAERDRAAAAAAAAQEEVGRCRSLVDQCALLAARRAEKTEERNRTGKDAAIYKDLVAAFGKKGIQAMIIENVIPEIEAEANRLLSLMADSGMQIQFHTQKELKKGGGAETLEIIIGDQAGDRPYECYSGGETFRINFAIRIALSRLLARRAGAQLQTIVIDEGFGSQDAQGRRRLIEAIESVKDEFARILVITHLDDIKDEFPTRLHVTKDASGSRVTVMR